MDVCPPSLLPASPQEPCCSSVGLHLAGFRSPASLLGFTVCQSGRSVRRFERETFLTHTHTRARARLSVEQNNSAHQVFFCFWLELRAALHPPEALLCVLTGIQFRPVSTHQSSSFYMLITAVMEKQRTPTQQQTLHYGPISVCVKPRGSPRPNSRGQAEPLGHCRWARGF